MKKTIHILLLFLVSVTSGLSQQHPVQVNVTLQPPYSLSLADYVAPGTDRVSVTLLLNDLNRPTYQARLRLTIEGLGITLRTRETFISQPIMLQGGIPTFVGATELAPYFNPQNIDFAGFTRQQYQSAGRLPEGLYRVCIEVLDYNRGNVVSNQGCTMAWMMLNDPPLLNQPQNNTKVIATEPQNVMFNWTPRHTASPNAAHSVEYLFRLVEVYPETRNPMEAPDVSSGQAMRVSRPIYETYTTATSFYYGVAEPNLIPGRMYAWQLQARDTEGRDLFKNQGYSEIFSFQFGDPCDVPASLEANVLSDKAIRLGWQPGFNHTAFRAEYRPVGGEGHWYSSESYLDYLNVDGLRPDTEYEVRLRGHCGTLQGDFTPTRRVRTAQASEQEFSCGQGSVIPINNTLPQMQLFEGQTIDAQGFDVRLTEVTGSNGRFSGAGYATVPFLANAKVRVTFDDIFVNEDLQMVRGTIRTVYNPDSPFMVDGDKLQEKVKEKISSDPQEEALPGEEEEIKEIARTITVDKEIDYVFINDEGMIVIVDSEGNESYYEQPVDEDGNAEETMVVDSEGNEWVAKGRENPIAKESTDASKNPSKKTNHFIVYDGQNYENGSVINLIYDRDSFVYQLALGNYSEDLNVHWEAYSEDENITSRVTEGANTHGEIYFIRMDAVYDRLKVNAFCGEQVISVILNRERPHFKIDNLWAIDGNNPNRKAEQGETLYLVRSENKNLRKVNYLIDTDAESNDFWIDEPVWNTTAKGDATINFTKETDKRNTSHYLSDWPSNSITTMKAFNDEKSVDVILIKEDRKSSSVVPPATQYAIEKLVENIQYISNTIEKLTKKGFDVKPYVNITGEQFNEEDPSSNLYYIVRDGSVSGGFSVSTGDIPIPGLSYSIPKVATVGGYLTSTIALQMYGGIGMRRLITEPKFITTNYDIGGNVTGSVNVGAKVEILPGIEQLKVNVRGYGGLSVTGDIKYRMEEDTNFVILQFYADPLKLGFNADVEVAGIKLLDIKVEDYYGERISYEKQW